MTAIFASEPTGLTKGMKVALIFSALFHVSLLIIGTLGLPYISKPPTIPPSAIAIEILDPSDITTTDKPPVKTRIKPVPDKPKEPPKTEKKVEAPPKVEAKEPPKIKPLEKPPEVKKDTVKPEPKVPPPSAETLEKPKPPEKKKPDQEEAIEFDNFVNSLLRNEADVEEFSEVEGVEKVAENTPEAPQAPTMTQHELNALSSQLAGCWQIPIGAENVHNTVVYIRIWVGSNRVVTRAEIVDQWRRANDPAFRALAESAKRATLDPFCNPVNIPMDRYDSWKDKYIEIPFDPRSVT